MTDDELSEEDLGMRPLTDVEMSDMRDWKTVSSLGAAPGVIEVSVELWAQIQEELTYLREIQTAARQVTVVWDDNDNWHQGTTDLAVLGEAIGELWLKLTMAKGEPGPEEEEE